jgi:NAD(P)-dependent dehydrogenase (short-subunit alcohol dehydrogenase family)
MPVGTESAVRRFEGKVVIVTGAGSLGDGIGNGKAAAMLYAREGAKVVLVDRRADAVAETEDLIRAEGGTCAPVTADVSLREGVEKYVERALSLYGGVDVLHSNVGIGTPGDLVSLSEPRWDLIYRVNVKSLFLGSQLVIPEMRKRGGGAIVNVSSIASLRSTAVPFAAYSSSKAAANQLVRSIAAEYAGDNIRCNTVVVGYVDTPTVAVAYGGTGKSLDELRADRVEVVPLKRLGDAWDVARAALFLTSDESGFITGTEVVVDGGLVNLCV